MSKSSSRYAILQSLLRLEQPLASLADAVRQVPWDSDEYLVMLTRGHLIAILDRYVQAQLAAEDVEGWANAIESRDDIGFHEDAEAEVREILHELANPVLTVPLTRDRAVELLTRLQ